MGAHIAGQTGKLSTNEPIYRIIGNDYTALYFNYLLKPFFNRPQSNWSYIQRTEGSCIGLW